MSRRADGRRMETVTLKLDPWHIHGLRDRANDRSKDLCGSSAGARDLSTRKIQG